MGEAALAEWRERHRALPETPSEEMLYELTLQQVWDALRQSRTPQPIRQKYHLAILRLVKATAPAEKKNALASLVSLARGTDGGESPAVAENAQDPDEE